MTDSIWPELQRPWPQKVIQQRKGRGGTILSYVGWRTISDRLDRVLGPAAWATDLEVHPTMVKARLTILASNPKANVWRENASGIEFNVGCPNPKCDGGWVPAEADGPSIACYICSGFGILKGEVGMPGWRGCGQDGDDRRLQAVRRRLRHRARVVW